MVLSTRGEAEGEDVLALSTLNDGAESCTNSPHNDTIAVVG